MAPNKQTHILWACRLPLAVSSDILYGHKAICIHVNLAIMELTSHESRNDSQLSLQVYGQAGSRSSARQAVPITTEEMQHDLVGSTPAQLCHATKPATRAHDAHQTKMPGAGALHRSGVVSCHYEGSHSKKRPDSLFRAAAPQHRAHRMSRSGVEHPDWCVHRCVWKADSSMSCGRIMPASTSRARCCAACTMSCCPP